MNNDGLRLARFVGNLRALYLSATPAQRQEGRIWYWRARGQLFDIAKRHGFPMKRVAYAAAALSANVEWSQNVAIVNLVCDAVRNGKRARGHTRVMLRKAVAILAHGDYRQLRGPKVEPFARVLLGDHRHAVVDRHMWRAAEPELGDREVTAPRARAVSEALRVLARQEGRSVAEVQAVVWTVARA